MNILIFRTDNPTAEIGLYDDQNKIDYITWEAHRQLAETIHIKSKQLLEDNKLNWIDIEGLICYEGPGSFTGLRIGMSVANSLAMSNNVPIVATSGDDWIAKGTQLLMSGKGQKAVTPEYGQPANVTQQRK